MSIAWVEAKEERIRRFGYRCEICGSTGHLVGHHEAHRKFQKDHCLEVWQLCQLRCEECEIYMHQNYPPNGNTPSRQKEVDRIISELLKAP